MCYIFLDKVACPKCKKLYKNDRTMRSHYSHDCKDKSMYHCDLCSYSTKRNYTLKKHYMGNHLEEWKTRFNSF